MENGEVSLPNQLPQRRYQKKRNLAQTPLTWAGGSLGVFGQCQQPLEWWSSRGSCPVWKSGEQLPAALGARHPLCPSLVFQDPPSSSKTLPHQLPSESKAVGSAIKGPVLSTQLLPTVGSTTAFLPRGLFLCRLLARPLEFGGPLSLTKYLSSGE